MPEPSITPQPGTDASNRDNNGPAPTLDPDRTSDPTVASQPTAQPGAGGPVGGGGSRFTILRLHAQGGLGQVHVARDEQLKRDVALKQIRPDRADQPQVHVRFLAE